MRSIVQILLPLAVMACMPEPPNQPPAGDQAPPRAASSASLRLEMVRHIVSYEARRDPQGRLRVYWLPEDDGGGSHEVAGINERFHPEMLLRLKTLIEAGQHAQAEAEAVEYIADYTDRTAALSELPAIRFLLRDIAWNRGPTGALRTLQIALRVPIDGRFGPVTRAALREAEADPAALVEALCAARETYERSLGRDESSGFWEGLANRWQKACIQARAYL